MGLLARGVGIRSVLKAQSSGVAVHNLKLASTSGTWVDVDEARPHGLYLAATFGCG